MLETMTKTQAKLAYSVKEASHQSSLCGSYLRRKIKSGELEVQRIGTRVLILHDDLIEFLKRGNETNN